VIDIIRLIEEQQKQIKDATRKSVAELNIKFAAMSEEELSRFREEVRPAPKAPEASAGFGRTLRLCYEDASQDAPNNQTESNTASEATAVEVTPH